MRNSIIILLILSFNLVIGQKTNKKISVNFEDVPLSDALYQIEELTKYRFYYAQVWIENEKVTGKFKDVLLTDLLDTLLNGTVINYYILSDGRIALNPNKIIYDELPMGFFMDSVVTDIQHTQTDNETSPPIFLNRYTTYDDNEIETIRIGKQGISNPNSFTLSGYAYNSDTGQPVSDLSIIVRNRNTGTVTNNEGFYEIELRSGVNQIETSSLGLRPTRKNIIMFSDGVYDFQLKESVERLEEVIVSADFDKNIEEATMSATEISSEETKTVPVVLGERNVLKIATTLPGISSAGEGATGFNVRGGSADQNLVLMDGAVIYNPTHFFGIFQALNPFTVENLKVYKGSIPAEFGGRLSSIFEITNKDGSMEEFKGEASIGPVTSNIALEVPIIKETSSLLIGGRSSYSDWILRSLDEESLKNSKASFYDVMSKYNHNINENNALEVSAYYSKDAFSITSDSVYNYSNRAFSASWNHKFNEKQTGKLLLTNSQYKFNIDFDGESNQDFRLGYRINETMLKLNMKYIYDKKHTFDYGISSKLYVNDPGEIVPEGDDSIISERRVPRDKALESAFFISDAYKINDRFLIDIGFRYSLFFGLGSSNQRIYEEGVPKNDGTLIGSKEYSNNEIYQTYSGPEARVSGRYFLGKDFSVKAAYNSTYQYIHTLSNNTTVSPIDTWKLSDVNIAPQRANQYALGLFKNFDGNDYELSLEGYYKKSNNNLDFKVGADLLLNETIETEVLQGEGKAYGVEFLFRKNNGKLNGWLGYTYSRSFIKLDSAFEEERVNEGEYFPANYDKPHDFSLITNYRLTRRFSFSANFIYQTGRPVTYPIGTYTFKGAEYAYFSERNKFRIPDFYRLDLSFNVEGNHKLKKLAHSFWNISIYNVLGRNNPYSVFFVTDNGELKAFKSSIFSIPIPTITYNFKF